MSTTGLLKLEAGLSTSVLMPKIINHVIKSPVNRAVDLLKKYKVKQEKDELMKH